LREVYNLDYRYGIVMKKWWRWSFDSWFFKDYSLSIAVNPKLLVIIRNPGRL